ncbi:MAG: polysaccharide biosynthesis tyrosine autokinase, partial [Actinomycetota bacterium]
LIDSNAIVLAAEQAIQPEETFRLREYLVVLRLRKWSIIAITLLALLAAIFYTKQQTPIYTSRVSVVTTDPLKQVFGTSARGLNITVETSLVTSLPVRQCAQQILAAPDSNKLGADLSKICDPGALEKVTPDEAIPKNIKVSLPVGTTAAPQTEALFYISYSDPSPGRAQLVAQAFALAYQQYKVTSAEQQLDTMAAPLRDKLDDLTRQLSKLNGEIDDLIVEAGAVASREEANRIDAEIRSKEAERDVVNTQVQQINTDLANLSSSRIVPPDVPAPAPLPASPSSPKLVINVALAFIVGLGFGIGLAFLREKLDDRLRGRADLEDRLGVPVLAVVPKIPGWKRRQGARLVAVDHPRGAAAEAYRTLRTSIMFAAAQRNMKILMVTSPGAGEGKSTTAANLAVGLAEAGKRVILLSADLRNPRAHEFFGLKNYVGLSNALSGEVKPWEALLTPERLDTLRVMASGPVPSKPAELLQSERMAELLSQLRDVADFVIVDTAPVLLVADALAVAPLADGVVVVADAQATNRGAATHVREQLDQVQAAVIGAVLNNFDPSKARSYAYYYYGYYPYRYGYGYQYGEAYRPVEQRNGDVAPRQRVPSPIPGPPGQPPRPERPS